MPLFCFAFERSFNHCLWRDFMCWINLCSEHHDAPGMTLQSGVTGDKTSLFTLQASPSGTHWLPCIPSWAHQNLCVISPYVKLTRVTFVQPHPFLPIAQLPAWRGPGNSPCPSAPNASRPWREQSCSLHCHSPQWWGSIFPHRSACSALSLYEFSPLCQPLQRHLLRELALYFQPCGGGPSFLWTMRWHILCDGYFLSYMTLQHRTYFYIHYHSWISLCSADFLLITPHHQLCSSNWTGSPGGGTKLGFVSYAVLSSKELREQQEELIQHLPVLFVCSFSLQDSPGTGLAQYPITNEQKKLAVPVIWTKMILFTDKSTSVGVFFFFIKVKNWDLEKVHRSPLPSVTGNCLK